MKKSPQSMYMSPEDAEQAFYEALEAGDLDALMELWADDEQVVCIHPNGPRLVGYAAVRESWKEILSAGSLMIRPTEVNVVTGLMISVHNLVEQVVSTGNRGQDIVKVVATNVFFKGPNGWKMVMHHASPATDSDEVVDDDDVPPTLH